MSKARANGHKRTRFDRRGTRPRKSTLEILESRRVFDSDVSWNAATGAITVADKALDGAADVVVVSSALSNNDGIYYVQITGSAGSPPLFNGETSNPKCPAIQVKSISVSGSTLGDSLDLTGVDAADLFVNTALPTHVSVYGGSGNDTIDLGDFGEYASGGGNNDEIVGGAGNDTIDGGSGNDSLDGAAGNDSILGGDGDDLIYGDDTLVNNGNDTLLGGAGTDSIYGGGGNDYIDLGDPAPVSPQPFEYADGGAGNDTIVAGATTNASIYGGSGNDTITTGNGVQPVVGGTYTPANWVFGGAGNDVITGGVNFDVLSGDAGEDYIIGCPANTLATLGDSISGGDGCDTLDGSTASDTISGDAGDDDIEGLGGDDTVNLTGGSGNNYINGVNDFNTAEGCHPHVGALAANPNPVTRPNNIVLSATGVTGGNGAVSFVTFYLENSNPADSKLQVDQDTELGVVNAADPNGAWTFPYDSSKLPLGNDRFYAVATNSNDFEGDSATTTATVQQQKVKVKAVANTTEGSGVDGTFTLERSGPTDSPLTVTYMLGGSAIEGQDYTVSPSGDTVVFPAGESDVTVDIAPLDDQLADEGDETVTLSIYPSSDPSSDFVADVPGSGTMTIDEDTEPTFTVSAPSSVEEGGDLTYTITRSGETSGSVTVYFSWSGSAIPGTDYTDPGDSVVFADGQTTQTVTPTLLDDEESGEPGEDLSLVLEGDDHYVIASPGYADVSIDEDTEATFTVSASPASVAEGGGVTYTITRSGEMSGSVTVYFSWSGSAVPGIDYTDPGDSVAFADGQTTQTVTPTLLDDDGDGEPDEDLSLVLEGDDHYDIGSPGYADVAIVEDDDSGGDSLMLNLPPRETGAAPAAITPAQARPYLQAAAREWEAAGVDPATLHRLLAGATVHVADLPDSLLGETIGDAIYLDENAAGYGWFLDDKLKDGGFAAAESSTERIAPPGSPAYGRADLLTAVTHELGHLLGLPDLSPAAAPGDIMDSTIGLSTRRVPAPGEGPQGDLARPDANETSTDAAFGEFAMNDEPGAPGPIPAAEIPLWRDAGGLGQQTPALVGAAGAKPRFAAEAEW